MRTAFERSVDSASGFGMVPKSASVTSQPRARSSSAALTPKIPDPMTATCTAQLLHRPLPQPHRADHPDGERAGAREPRIQRQPREQEAQRHDARDEHQLPALDAEVEAEQ